jgi:uncharacterized protein
MAELIHKMTVGKIVKDMGNSDPRVLTFVASDETIDRQGDQVMCDGWNVSDFTKNPVILWSHDYSKLPVAKGVRVEKDLRNKQLLISVRFPTIKELHPDSEPSEEAKFCETVFQMYKQGYLSAGSVGFSAEKMENFENADPNIPEWCQGHRITQQTLYEYSLCPVPANQNSLVQARSIKSLDSKSIDRIEKAYIEEKTAIPYHKYPLADEGASWDGPKVIADSEVEDLKKICTWYDGSKDDADLVKGDFKLPHHMTKADGYKAVWKGVAAAYGALMGSRGGVDIPDAEKEKCKAHLAKHYLDFNKTVPEDKAAWVEQCKAMGFDDLVEKEASPVVQKIGARLSAATMAMIDELEKCTKEMDEAIAACKTARDNMASRIKVLRDGATEEPGEPVEEPDGDEKSINDCVIKIVG